MSGGLRVYSLMNEEDSATLDIDEAIERPAPRLARDAALSNNKKRPDPQGAGRTFLDISFLPLPLPLPLLVTPPGG